MDQPPLFSLADTGTRAKGPATIFFECESRHSGAKKISVSLDDVAFCFIAHSAPEVAKVDLAALWRPRGARPWGLVAPGGIAITAARSDTEYAGSWQFSEIRSKYDLSRDGQTFELLRRIKTKHFREFFMPETIIHKCESWQPPFKSRISSSSATRERVVGLVVDYHPLLNGLQAAVDERLFLDLLGSGIVRFSKSRGAADRKSR